MPPTARPKPQVNLLLSTGRSTLGSPPHTPGSWVQKHWAGRVTPGRASSRAEAPQPRPAFVPTLPAPTAPLPVSFPPDTSFGPFWTLGHSPAHFNTHFLKVRGETVHGHLALPPRSELPPPLGPSLAAQMANWGRVSGRHPAILLTQERNFCYRKECHADPSTPTHTDRFPESPQTGGQGPRRTSTPDPQRKTTHAVQPAKQSFQQRARGPEGCWQGGPRG